MLWRRYSKAAQLRGASACRASMDSTLLLLLAIVALPFGHSRDNLSLYQLHRREEPASLCAAVLQPRGYPCHEYTVVTDDGFILGIQRINHGFSGNETIQRPPVFLQHGLFQGGDTWFENTPEQSLGFLLADAGFDVWVGNVRGTHWSHGHTSLSRRDKAFWDWSWSELAEKDLPAMLELVYKTTGGSQVYYVGHSQGTIMAFAAFTQPKLVRMIAAAALLSPISFLNHITSSFALTAAHMYADKFLKTVGVHEVNLRSELGIQFVDLICSSENVDCGDMLTSITGPNCCFNNSRISYYLQFEPHSSSTKNMEHLFQMIRKGNFEKFDYGWLGNMRHYVRFSPPTYDLSSIPNTLPLWMAYGGLDALADENDIMLTLQNLQCSPEILYLEKYAHLDFILSVQGKTDLYDKLISFFIAQVGHSLT